MDSTFLILSILVPLVGSFICLLFPKGVREVWAFLAVGVSFVFLLLLIPPIAAGKDIAIQLISQNGRFFNLSFLADGISLIFALVFSLVGMIALLYSLTYMKRYENQREYYFMTTLMIASLIGVAFSQNLVLLYVFWELAALTTWRLVGFYRERRIVTIADKTFLMTFLGSSLMLLGFIILYGQAGTLNLTELKGLSLPGLSPILFLIFLGIIAKSACLPIHTWLPDAHPVAPSPMSAILSGVEVEVGLFAFLRIFSFTFGISWNWILLLAIISSLIGAGAALLEKDIKRIIAYSTVSQVGYILLGFALLSKIGVIAGLLYFMIHAVGKAGLFLGAGVVEQQCEERNIDKLGGLMKSMPLTGVGFLFSSLSIMGLPPFGGFYAKLMVILATVKEGHFFIAALAVLAAILTMLYLFRLFNGIFLGKARMPNKLEKSRSMVGCVLALGIISLILGLFISQIIVLPNVAIAGLLK
jgi:formate hydrogenlyase subunit 3/multisubunit Na+/H+ antiporter MnhD subunit